MQPRVSTLDEAGDLDAPPGTRAWAVAVRLEMQGLIKDRTSSAEHYATWRKIMEKYQGWRALTDAYGEPFASYAEFCKAPAPYGLGHDPVMIDTLMAERMTVQVLDKLDRETQREPGRPTAKDKSLYIVQDYQGDAPTGNTRQRALRKLRKDAPELHARVIAGEVSPNAAMIEAGFRRKSITIPADAPGAAQAIIRNFDIDAIAEIVNILVDRVSRKAE